MTEDARDPVQARADWHVQLAEAKMLFAEAATGRDQQALLDEARDALIRAERLAPGKGAWSLARINARLGKGDLCRKWMERALHEGVSPSREAVMQDGYFERVRGQKWFKSLVKKLG